MTRVVFCIALSFFIAVAAPGSSIAQSTKKVVVTENIPVAKPTPARPAIIVGQSNQTPGVTTQPSGTTPIVVGQSGTPRTERPREVYTGQTNSFREIKAMIADAKRQMQTRPITIASTGSVYEGVEIVRVAFADKTTGKVDFVTLEKEAFLSTTSDKAVTSNNGRPVLVRTIRGNGVNTPVTITGTDGTAHLPLLVQYPRVTNKRYEETAYYVSTHPGLVTPEVVNAGRLYVRNVLEIAREKLREKGIKIDPKVADIAERLAAVEHVDHDRFHNEPHSRIYDDVYTLFALNEGDTYKYAVSSAGAGGLVQMIPSTYRMVRSWHPSVGLMPDFVEGMRNHVNAGQAMLLYMQRTWNDLAASPAVAEAMLSGYATQKHLMAAGYNSNPARLPGYLNRGGENWATLIPRETKIYLQIYDSIERNVPVSPRTR
jgi:hypothetical protein